MSADRWSVCPRCEKKRAEAAAKWVAVEGTLEDVEARIRELREEANSMPQEERYSLREDYEWYLDGETVKGDYSCECRVCGFSRSVTFKDGAWGGES